MTSDLERLPADDFARRFALRGPGLMWFLGAGASASSGVPTAWDMIWDFKQRLFVTQRRVSPAAVADLSNPGTRRRLQEHIDAAEKFPPEGAPNEYAALFEAVYPSEPDRTAYLDSHLHGAKPAYGHLALATLMHAEKARVVWTTNFDPLVSDACAKVYDGTGALSAVDLDRAHLASQFMANERWPIEFKIHGDFRSRRLKNTTDELREQDQQLRTALVDACRRYGLIVAGYSGRDDSVMNALEDVLSDEGGFPNGLFWLHRGEGSPLPRVERLLSRARTADVEAFLVEIDDFDGILRDLIRSSDVPDTTVLDQFAGERSRWTAPPRVTGKRSWPVVRLNGLRAKQVPTTCRKIECGVGGFKELREAVEKAEVDIIVSRTKAAVLAFGRDNDVRKALEPHGITEFDLYPLDPKRLRYESSERGLLRDALSRALAREFEMALRRRRSADLLAPTDPGHKRWKGLARSAGQLSGVVQRHPELTWREGVAVRLEWANDDLWLLVDHRTVFDGMTAENKAVAAAFGRERNVPRYNRKLNALIAFWAELFSSAGTLRALGISDGVDAVFELAPTTAFSRRSRP